MFTELYNALESESSVGALEVASRMALHASEQLQHGENHAALCQLQRDITGNVPRRATLVSWTHNASLCYTHSVLMI